MLPVDVARPRAAQRQRRSSAALTPRRARSPRLRAGEADRQPIRRRPEVSRRLALPHALPPRAPRSHSGTVGREERSAPEALLSPHRGRTDDARLAAAELERVLHGIEPRRAAAPRVETAE